MIRLRSIAVAVAVVTVLGGCVAIPTSGAVQTSQIQADTDEQTLALPPGPVEGQSASEIVQGFIRAGQGPQGEFQVAQEYLAPGADWRGTAQVLVTSSPIQPVQVDDDTFTVTVLVTAEVDQNGRYVGLEVPSLQTLSYDVTQVGGQSRISNAAPGVVLSPSNFTSAFAAYPLYYFDASFAYLVPDLRWFPTNNQLAERIVTELLATPSSGVVISAFPAGTTGHAELAPPRVSVDLAASVGSESPLSQRRILQELTASLLTLPNIGEVVVTADGLSLAPAPENSVPDSQLQVRDAIGGSGGKFGTLVVDGVAPLTGIADAADVFQPTSASLARDRRSVAVLGPKGVTLVPASGAPVAIDQRPALVAPTVDPEGFVWSVPRDDPGGLIAVDRDLTVHQIPLDADGAVTAIELSRDGTRLLVALSTADGPRLFVAGVQRDADLAPVALSTPVELPQADPVVDIAWVDGSTVAVLALNAGGVTHVTLVPLGGPVVDLGTVDGGAQIVGGNLQAGLRVLAGDGTVLRPSSAGGWVDTGLVASFLGTQQ